ncbi:MAG: hypothetical protein FWF44_07920 [Defluviitaleaceae bacterium]|nr:hypothetical protein [Defluviitaleaceae bacterium]
MSKAQMFGPEAERLYVLEGCGPAEIASRLGVGERTIRAWKERAGDWDAKRGAYQGSRQSFHEELYEFGRELLTAVRRQMAEGEDVPQSRILMLMRLIPNLIKVKDYEQVAVTRKSAAPVAMTAEELARIIDKELCGK